MESISVQRNLEEVNLHIDRLYLNVSFDCQIKALIETNVEKKNSSSVQFNPSKNEAVFSQKLRLMCDPKKPNILKITLIILKNKSTKMVGQIKINLENDPNKRAGINKYVLKRCPQKNVRLKMFYEYGPKDTLHKTIDIHSIMGNPVYLFYS
jgi:hypothetical protein